MKDQTKNKQRPPHRFTKGNKFGNRFKPGQSGNPKGRRGSLREIFNSVFNEPDNTGKVPADVALTKLKGYTKRGDLKAIKLWLEYGLSKPPQEINLGGQKDNPLKWDFVIYGGDETKDKSCSNETKKEE
jgi:hypothetical protein